MNSTDTGSARVAEPSGGGHEAAVEAFGCGQMGSTLIMIMVTVAITLIMLIT